MDAPVKHQQCAKFPVISCGTGNGNLVAVVQIYLIPLESAGLRDTLNQQVEWIRYYFAKPPNEVHIRSLQRGCSGFCHIFVTSRKSGSFLHFGDDCTDTRDDDLCRYPERYS